MCDMWFVIEAVMLEKIEEGLLNRNPMSRDVSNCSLFLFKQKTAFEF